MQYIKEKELYPANIQYIILNNMQTNEYYETWRANCKLEMGVSGRNASHAVPYIFKNITVHKFTVNISGSHSTVLSQLSLNTLLQKLVKR